jgi:phage baseplate assembly protein V
MIATIDARIQRALGRIRQAFRGRGGNINADGPVMLADADALADESLRGAEVMQNYGFTSHVPPGFMYVAIPVGGKTAHSIMVATEHGTYRIKGLKTGEVAIYTDEGDSVVLKRGRLIEVTTQTFRLNTQVMEVNASEKIDFNTPMVTCSEQATVQHRLTGNGSLTITNTSGTGGASSFVGDINQTGGGYTTDHDVVAGTVSLDHHRHANSGGSGIGGEPVA